MVKCSFFNFSSIISLSSTDFRLIRLHRLQLYVKRSGFKMLYELVTVYDNRLQSSKSQIKLNEAVFGKRQGKWKKTIILSIRILHQCSALPDKEQFSEKLSLSKHFPARGLTGSVENNINVSEIIKLFFGLWRK